MFGAIQIKVFTLDYDLDARDFSTPLPWVHMRFYELHMLKAIYRNLKYVTIEKMILIEKSTI